MCIFHVARRDNNKWVTIYAPLGFGWRLWGNRVGWRCIRGMISILKYIILLGRLQVALSISADVGATPASPTDMASAEVL